MGRVTQAEAHLLESLKMQRKLKNKVSGIGGNLIGLSIIYMGTDRLAEAKQALQEALELAKKSSYQKLLVDALRYAGRLEILLGNYSEAQAFFLEALETDVAKSDASHAVDIEFGLARVETYLENHQEAMDKLRQALGKTEQAYLQLDGLIYISELFIEQDILKEAIPLLGFVQSQTQLTWPSQNLANQLMKRVRENMTEMTGETNISELAPYTWSKL